ncbi:MAG: dihydroorotate dehydrogenase electron transfer subunit [Desulfobacterales bacterium]|nr:dihydroorotate dehydrogenase electron transfer subunit [Desulfobacterales bacterium]
MIDETVAIAFNEPVADATFLMGLNAPRIASGAIPGQFVMLRVGPAHDPLLRRPFSICGIRHAALVLILYKVVGRGTALMSGAAPGQRMTVLGPLGRGFSRPLPGRKPLLVAGGIGIAPLVFLAQTLQDYSPVFLAGFRCAAEVVSSEKVGLSGVNLRLATDDGSTGFRGYVTELMASWLGRDAENSPEVYACGPSAMLKQIAGLTAQRGLPGQMSLEAYMACGLGACQGCAIKSSDQDKLTYYLACRDGPVFNARTIDWEVL